ncbi:hypothetical protein Cni_G03779 [Canna indica]|uniref:Amino acid transporter transmembrane domain-containing protein n=1 Tax=Canna indica TaxID=4628 RepID=A0AAQ3JUB6_9LILI|nr:hypothetical protein Cni_G03779 [Canna indica]
MHSTYSALPITSSVELQTKFPGLRHDPPSKNLLEEDFGDDLPLILAAADAGRAADTGSGIPGAVFNLATSIIGAGIMALPAAMKVLGLLLGFVSIILMGILSEISIELLVRFSVLCKSSSYGDVVQSALGRPLKIVSEICVIVNNAGILVVYLIIIGDVMSGSSKHIGVFDQLLGHGEWDHRKLVIFLVLVIFLAPLCALEKIDSLSLTSAASVALAVVFVIVSCIIALVKLFEGQITAPRMGPDFGSKAAILDLLVVVPIMTNAYVCHFNVQPIYNELKGRTPRKMYLVSRITTALCIAIYASTAVSGYLLFGDDTEPDVLTNFDKDLGIPFSSILNYVVRIGYVLHLVLVFPVVHFSFRQTVDSLIFSGSAPGSRKRMLALTVVLLAIVYLGSTTIPNIWVAFKFTGATTGMSLGFIFPALIALRLDRQEKILKLRERYISWLMLVLAVVASILGVVGNIYTLKKKSE